MSIRACYHRQLPWLPMLGVEPQPSAVDVEDVDGDGKLDIVVADTGSNMASALIGRGNGGFDPRIVRSFPWRGRYVTLQRFASAIPARTTEPD
jgi:hypothetical protein